MSYRLSLLDKTPVDEGRAAGDAYATTLLYAELADRLGYHRFWAAEHHGSRALASAAPEIVVSHVLARTRRIRVGTAGILLSHYSPFKVAEVFGVLSQLAPGRVDLGIGRAVGGLPETVRALQEEFAPERTPFEDKLADLDLFLKGAASTGHRHQGAEIQPRPALLPERFLLGSSETSATLAASLGWGFVHAGHHDGDHGAIDATLRAARAAGPDPILAVTAFAAPTREEALAKADRRSFKAVFRDGFSINVGSLEAVEEHARQLGEQPVSVEERRPQIIAGTPDDVHRALGRLAERHGVAEFVLDVPVAAREARLASIELIARADARRAAA